MGDAIYEKMRVEFGSLYRLSQLLGLTTNAVYQWQNGRKIPLRHIKTIEGLSEGRITRLEMRPDIFGE